MKLYGALMSPFVRKVAVVAAEKGISVESARGGPGVTDPEFLAASPFGKIPAIDDDGFTLSDSTAIVFYLEALAPEPALLPVEAKARGRTIWLDEFADTIFAASALKILSNRVIWPRFLKIPGNEIEALAGVAELPRSFAYVDGIAPATGWLAGDMFTFADIAVASVVQTLGYVDQSPDRVLYPALAAWYDRVAARPSWQAVAARENILRQRLFPSGAA